MAKPRINKRHALLLRWTALFVVCTVAVVATLAVANRRGDGEVAAAGAEGVGLTSVLRKNVGDAEVAIRFEDVTERIGLSFRHFPATRASLLPEDMGSGIACGDFDGDGWTDVFCVNFAGSVAPEASVDREAGRSRLYRNASGRHFEDVTDEAGIDWAAYGMGAAWGDWDNDGDLDLYITAYGENVLYENRGDGTFDDITAQAGVQDARFSAGASWGDYDRDGHLDLYVCNYVDFVFRGQDQGAAQRQYATELPYTLNPSSYPPLANALFHNNGDGTFTDVAERAGVANPNGRSLSASWLDMDNDGWVDLYVANDVSNNGVYRNRRDGTFEDVGASSLAADYRGAMGIAVADFDHDLDQDLLITHWIAQENALYCNMVLDKVMARETPDRLWFLDAADLHGLGQSSLDMIGWATGFADFDNDTTRDLWLVNGSTFEDVDDHSRLLAQRPMVFWNRGDGDYVDVATRASPRLAEPMVGRGGAQLDLDRDGRVDLILLAHGGEAVVLRNVSRTTGHWLRLDLRQAGGNTYALGARAYVTSGGRTQMVEVGCSSSYLSQDEHTLHFGLGGQAAVESLRIVWPDGAEEHFEVGQVDQTMTMVRTVPWIASES